MAQRTVVVSELLLIGLVTDWYSPTDRPDIVAERVVAQRVMQRLS